MIDDTTEQGGGYLMDEFTDRNLVYDLVLGAQVHALAQWYGETVDDIETAIDVLQGEKPVSMTGMGMEIGYTGWPIKTSNRTYQLDMEQTRSKAEERVEEKVGKEYEAIFGTNIETLEDVFHALTWL